MNDPRTHMSIFVEISHDKANMVITFRDPRSGQAQTIALHRQARDKDFLGQVNEHIAHLSKYGWTSIDPKERLELEGDKR